MLPLSLPSQSTFRFRLPDPPSGVSAMRSVGPIIGAGFFAIVLVAVLGRNIVLHPIAMLTPTSFVIGTATNIATAAILLAIGRYSAARASTFLLAALYADFALIAFAMLLCIPLDPGSQPLLPVNAQAAPYLYIGWKALSGLGAMVYAYLRRDADGDAQTQRRTVIIALAAVAALAATLTIALGCSAHLAPVISGTAFTPLYRFVLTPITTLLCIAGTIAVFRIPAPNDIDRAFGYAVIAAALQGILPALGGQQYTVPWYLSRFTYVSAEAIVLIMAIRMLIGSRETLRTTEAALHHSRHESQLHARRIRALWEVASQHSSEEAQLQAALDLGTRSLRPGADLCGYFCRIEDGRIWVDVASGTDAPETVPAVDTTMQSVLFPGGKCAAWNDLHAAPETARFGEPFGFRSLIGTPLQIGRKSYVLVFGSPDAMHAAPFAEDDVAFVDVLAAFIGHQFSERAHRERIQYQIEHDALTGLYNRAQFRATLRQYVSACKPFALAFADLDNFRAINETSGHLIGDELLVEVAAELRGVSDRDVVGRIAGDDFGIILDNVASREAALAQLARYAELFERPFHTGDRDGTRLLSVSASFGLAHFPGDATTADELLRAADVALERAKESGGARIVFYDPGMNESLRQRYLQTVELADAIDAGHLGVAYQPTFSLDTCQISGAEALVRWNHPTRGELLPHDFLEFAEKNGLIGRLTRFVMDRVIRDLASLPALAPGFRCFFNLASAQIGDLAFINDVERRLRETPGIANHLGVEITETAAITNLDDSVYALERFRRLGLRIAIDDFGTGYSSLSYLKRLPVDVIKIDRSFVTGLPSDAKDVALCEVLLQIASRFDLVPLAEGIETAAQLQWLRDHECDFGQGYLVSKPLPFEQLVALLPKPDGQTIVRANQASSARCSSAEISWAI